MKLIYIIIICVGLYIIYKSSHIQPFDTMDSDSTQSNLPPASNSLLTLPTNASSKETKEPDLQSMRDKPKTPNWMALSVVLLVGAVAMISTALYFSNSSDIKRQQDKLDTHKEVNRLRNNVIIYNQKLH